MCDKIAICFEAKGLQCSSCEFVSNEKTNIFSIALTKTRSYDVRAKENRVMARENRKPHSCDVFFFVNF